MTFLNNFVVHVQSVREKIGSKMCQNLLTTYYEFHVRNRQTLLLLLLVVVIVVVVNVSNFIDDLL